MASLERIPAFAAFVRNEVAERGPMQYHFADADNGSGRARDQPDGAPNRRLGATDFPGFLTFQNHFDPLGPDHKTTKHRRIPHFHKSSRNSEAGSTPVTSKWSRARVQATYSNCRSVL